MAGDLSPINVFEDAKPTSNINLIEASSSRSPMYLPSQFEPYNPNKLFRKKGNYDLYDDMRDDDQIKSIMQTKKWIMLSSGWDIALPDDVDEKKGQEITDFLYQTLQKDIELPFESSIEEILSAMDYGVSITEIVWKIEDSKFKIKYLKTRAPHGFELYTDDLGNLINLKQSAGKGYLDLDPKNFIIYPYQKQFDGWYGTSDLNACYRPWWAKEFIIKAWNMFLDKFGSPTVLGKYDKADSNKADQQNLYNVVKAIQTGTAVTIPSDVIIELLEAKRAGDGGYEKAIDKYNLMIARSLLMPDLMGLSGSQTSGGSFALGQSQYQMFLLILDKTRKQLELMINKQIIKPLVEYNFGKLDFNPEFKFKQMSNAQKVDALKVWGDFVAKAGYKPSDDEINWGRNILGAPEGEIEDEPLPVNPLMPNVDPNKDKAEDKADDKKPDEETKVDPKEEKLEMNKEGETVDAMRLPIMAEHKQNFAAVERRINGVQDAYLQSISKCIKFIGEALIDTIKKGKFIENKRLDKINDLNLKYKDRLRIEIKLGMKEMYELGQKDAKKEFTPKETKYIDLTDDQLMDEIIYDAPVFITTTIVDDILKQAKIVLKNGITQGLAYKDVISQLKLVLQPYDPAFDGSRLETIVRTNFMKIYNNAKQAYFKPAEDSGEIVAYQYTAIMDSRTCFIAGTKVTTSKGLKNIEDIKCSDYVLTLDGFKKVIAPIKKKYHKNIYEIKSGTDTVLCTENHPFYTQNGWVEASDLRVGNIIIKPKPYMFIKIFSIINFILRKSHDFESIFNQKGFFAFISLFIAMPISSINFYTQAEFGDKKINTVSSYASFLNKLYLKAFKRFPEFFLKFILTTISSITCYRAKIRTFAGFNVLSIYSTYREIFATMNAFFKLSVSKSTLFRAKYIVCFWPGVKYFIAYFAIQMLRLSAFSRTIIESMRLTFRDRKLFMATNTHFSYSLSKVSTFERAKQITASFYGILSSVYSFFARRTIMPSTTSFSKFKVGTSLFNHKTIIDRLGKSINDSGLFVYDISVDGKHEYFANNFLVHNSNICEELNGNIYLVTNPISGNIEPPNHFNCRSTMVPITKQEFQDQEIFGADEEQNKEFFPDGKFQESDSPEGFEMQPGGFWGAK